MADNIINIKELQFPGSNDIYTIHSTQTDKLASAVTISVGNKSLSFDGSSSIKFELDDIGVVKSMDTAGAELCLYAATNDGSNILEKPTDDSVPKTVMKRDENGKSKVGNIDSSDEGEYIANKNYVDTKNAKINVTELTECKNEHDIVLIDKNCFQDGEIVNVNTTSINNLVEYVSNNTILSIDYPVTSINSKTGAVTLTATDVGAGTYSKPTTGIPKEDLDESVQLSLSNADSALQSIPVATTDSLGGIKLNYKQSNKNYPVKIDSDNNAYVNVPWMYHQEVKATTSCTIKLEAETGATTSSFISQLDLPLDIFPTNFISSATGTSYSVRAAQHIIVDIEYRKENYNHTTIDRWDSQQQHSISGGGSSTISTDFFKNINYVISSYYSYPHSGGGASYSKPIITAYLPIEEPTPYSNITTSGGGNQGGGQYTKVENSLSVSYTIYVTNITDTTKS